MKSIISKVKEKIELKPNAVIAIDGCCASGKTTLASNLAERFDAQIIHMDDFFLPPEMRTAERLSQPGGNIHYERFVDEVVSGLVSGNKFSYRVFCCRTGAFEQTKAVDPAKPVIVEGAYALHPLIPDIYDLKVFLETSHETQLNRICERNGKDALEVFKSKWIPFENNYFDEFNIRNKCDYVLLNE
ncbi:MAG: uridine kinase [Clostridia bacterium]|nr:uridine kinase [Clostridia bacterium]